MDNEKFNLILNKLLERTKEGKLKWKTTADEDTFLVVLMDSSVSLTHDFDSENEHHYFKFDFRNENGETVASMTLVDFIKSETESFEKAKKLFELARQQSFSNNKVVDRILEQLAA